MPRGVLSPRGFLLVLGGKSNPRLDASMLRTLHFRGYRSLRDFRLKLGRVTVVTGGNGVGKSNVYQALALLRRMAQGRFAASVAAEGGLPGMLWAGVRRKDEALRICWEVGHDAFHLEMECGMIPTAPGDKTQFRTDPDIKLECLRLSDSKGRIMASRKGPSIDLRNPDGKMESLPLPVHAVESMLSEVRDGILYPALGAARETLLSWRFYHHFRTDPRSPLRQPSIGFWSPVLSEDGGNLAATLQTLIESRRSEPLDEAFAEAFPGCQWSPVDDEDRFQLRLLREDLRRWLSAAELSDGTLRFFCLCAALLTPKPPLLMVFNEPESSLHPSLMPPLANLFAKASADTQIVIVTHSRELAAEIANRCDANVVDLVSHKGETRPAAHAGMKRVWTFDGD
jgi:predicted ATPase